MSLFEMMRDGGAGAFAAMFFGGVGALVGLVAIVVMFFSRRAARIFGIVALVIAAFAASVGVVGMQMGLRATDAALAGQPPMVHERIRVEGFDEAQCAAQIGFGAALAPVVLGAITALVGGASVRKWGLTIAAIVFASVPLAGALVASVASAHPLYPFDPRAPAPWDLKDARAKIEVDVKEGCDDFDHALDEAHQASLDPTTIVPDWRTSATMCAREIFSEVKAAGGEIKRPARASSREPRTWNADALLDSPLVVDKALRGEIEAYKRTVLL